MLATDAGVGDAREIHAAIVERLLLHRAAREVEAETVQGDLARSEPVARVAPEILQPTHVEDDAVALVVGVQAVEDVARLDLEPAHFGAPGAARQDADPRRVVIAPVERHAALERQREIEDHRQIHEQHVPRRDGEVVDHRRAADRDLFALDAAAHRG